MAAFAAALVPAAPASAAPSLVPVGSFERPVHVASPPDDLRLFVVEQHAGTVRVVDASGTILPSPFLDVGGEIAKGSEEGLLSIAFAPDYATSGLFYVYLTGTSATGQLQVREYQRSATDPNRADPVMRRLVLSQDHPTNANHNGGSMAFGPDGLLYVGIGDGGAANDPPNNAQNPNTLLGKIVRFDPRRATPAGTGDIFQLGLRNPWRFSLDRSTGDLVIGDVGQDAREEIDFAPAARNRLQGANWGWRCYEGSLPGPPCSTQLQGDVKPVHELTHGPPPSDGVCSITGGVVVRDPGLPTLAGRYLYGDICLPELRSLQLAEPRATDDRVESSLEVASVTTFAEDACGRVLVASLNGAVSRVVDGAPSACTPGRPPSGPQPGPPGGGPAVTDCGLSVRFPKSRTRASVRRSGLSVAVRLRGPCRVAAGARVPGVGTLKASSRRAVPGARTVLRLKPTRRTRRLLARRGSVALIRVTATPDGGPARQISGRTRLTRR